jgi:hypothetical protein
MLGDVPVALGNQACKFLVQRLAIRHLLVEFARALLGFQRAQIVRQFVILEACEFRPARRDVADQIAIASYGFR